MHGIFVAEILQTIQMQGSSGQFADQEIIMFRSITMSLTESLKELIAAEQVSHARSPGSTTMTRYQALQVQYRWLGA